MFLSIFLCWIVMISALYAFVLLLCHWDAYKNVMQKFDIWSIWRNDNPLLLRFFCLISGHPVLHQRVSEDSSGPGEDLPSRVQPGLPWQDGGRQRFWHLWQAAVRNGEKVLRGESLFDWRESLKANANQSKTLPVHQIREKKIFLLFFSRWSRSSWGLWANSLLEREGEKLHFPSLPLLAFKATSNHLTYTHVDQHMKYTDFRWFWRGKDLRPLWILRVAIVWFRWAPSQGSSAQP